MGVAEPPLFGPMAFCPKDDSSHHSSSFFFQIYLFIYSMFLILFNIFSFLVFPFHFLVSFLKKKNNNETYGWTRAYFFKSL
jgi:hypothetical protein